MSASLVIGEHPDVVVHSLDVDLGFIDVDAVACQNGLEDSLLGGGVVVGQVAKEIDPSGRTHPNTEQMLGYLDDNAVG
jgi:hypothetical protein